jgi:hypothetical protein
VSRAKRNRERRDFETSTVAEARDRMRKAPCWRAKSASAGPKRLVAWIPDTAYVDGRGWRVSIVTEDEPGHHPTGIWPNDGTRTMPWFWGHDLETARDLAYEYNAKMGISREDTDRIVLSSIAAQLRVDASILGPKEEP